MQHFDGSLSADCGRKWCHHSVDAPFPENHCALRQCTRSRSWYLRCRSPLVDCVSCSLVATMMQKVLSQFSCRMSVEFEETPGRGKNGSLICQAGLRVVVCKDFEPSCFWVRETPQLIYFSEYCLEPVGQRSATAAPNLLMVATTVGLFWFPMSYLKMVEALVDPIMPVLDGHFETNRRPPRKLGITLNLKSVIMWTFLCTRFPYQACRFSFLRFDFLPFSQKCSCSLFSSLKAFWQAYNFHH